MYVFVREKNRKQRRALRAMWGAESLIDVIKIATRYEEEEDNEYEYLVYTDPIELYITGNCRRTRMYIDSVMFPDHIMAKIIDKPWLSLDELRKGNCKHVENYNFLFN